MSKSLVIVESPTKAKTISKFLPKDFVVESTIGHIRDLPSSAKDIPPSYKDKDWARLGIDVANGFQPLYVVPAEKKKQVAKLKQLIKSASTIYLATDEDREGESISWHVVDLLKPKVPRRRLVFHEITREAIQAALKNPREIDQGLVQAQETRRILDRLYGYEVSPVLWRKIARGLSAGRVQSVAVRIIVDREYERRRFLRAAYWDIEAHFRKEEGPAFEASLLTLGGQRVASGKDFDGATGQLRAASEAAGADGGAEKVVWVQEEQAKELAERLKTSTWKVTAVERKPDTQSARPPFTTSTLQQEANRKLRLSARATMTAAQRLYENGFITYMRTDSTTLSDQALTHARRVIETLYGKPYLTSAPRQYRTTVKNAQEAHEAIRPAGDFLRPEEIRGEVADVELKVYELIWKRTIACQMADARFQRTTLQISDGHAVFQASGKIIDFPGYLRAYVEGADDPDAELADQERALPDVEVGDTVNCDGLEARGHSTQPPPRYTEASLVKELEANGVGRPSTYAAIIDTILRREYVIKQGNALVPTFTAFAVVKLLENFFRDLVDVQFTARMEDDLDEISLGRKDHLPYLKSFYFGTRDKEGLHRLLQKEIDPRESCTLFLGKDAEGRIINVRIGRYGPYLERDGDRAPIPAGLAPDELTVEKAVEILQTGAGPQVLGNDPESGKPVYLRVGRFGPYVQLGDAEEGEKPKMKSLLPGMKPEEVTLDQALRLLRLPRTLGTDPEKGEEVFADFGRYGPYIKRGPDARTLEKPEDVFDVTLERALELLRQEKPKRGWGGRGPQVLRELGIDTGSGAAIRLLAGRYGPYVTDGETNASIPRGREPQSVTLEEALELIKARRAAGPAKKRPRRRGPPAGPRKTAAQAPGPEAAGTQPGGPRKDRKASREGAAGGAAKRPPGKKRPRKKTEDQSSED